MKRSIIWTSLVATWLSAAEAEVFTYQTLNGTEVQLATTTIGSAASAATTTTSPYYTLNRDDLAYPTFTSVSPEVAEAAAAPGLPNATYFTEQGIQLVLLGKNATESNCQHCKDVMSQLQASTRVEQGFIGRMSSVFCQTVSSFLPLPICTGLFQIGSNDVGAIFGSYGTDMQSQDGQLLCAFVFGLCELPPPPQINMTALFNGTTKPPPKTLTPSTKEPLKVLHISDYHLDPRYVVGSEANCTGTSLATVCCRVFPYTNLSIPINNPASLFGNYKCDTPEPLATSVFRAVPNVTGFGWDNFSFGIFTGDLVSHDIWELTPEYVLANELISFQQFFDGMGGVKMYPTLGNHDTYPQGFTTFPKDEIWLPENASYPVEQLYNYENVSAAWQNYGWLTADEAQEVVTSGRGIYRARTAENLTIISLNSDVWYNVNMYAYISANDFDPTGIFRTLVNWLLEAEQNDEPVWLIQHVNVGGGTSYEALPAASDVYYQIVDRFNNTIRATFFGHTHNDEFGVFYANNGTNQSAETATSVAYIGPSVTTYQDLNAGFRYYLVDADTFNVLDSVNFYANVSNTDDWAASGDVTWEFMYSARATYDPDGTLLESNSTPLTAAFWHQVAENIKTNDTWFRVYTDLRNKLFRPYQEVNELEALVVKCGVTSMSVPVFEECLGSMATLNSFL